MRISDLPVHKTLCMTPMNRADDLWCPPSDIAFGNPAVQHAGLQHVPGMMHKRLTYPCNRRASQGLTRVKGEAFVPSARLIACMRRRGIVLSAVIAAIRLLGKNIKLRLGFKPGRLSMLLRHGKRVWYRHPGPWLLVFLNGQLMRYRPFRVHERLCEYADRKPERKRRRNFGDDKEAGLFGLYFGDFVPKTLASIQNNSCLRN